VHTRSKILKPLERQLREGKGEKQGEYLARQNVALERFLSVAPLEAADVPKAVVGLMPHAGVQEGQEVVHALLHGQHLKGEGRVRLKAATPER
jgi:hypothetical protein